jgi:hypothetical protein
LPGILTGLETFAFADAGTTWLRARAFFPAASYHLASAGAGIRLPMGADSL